MFKSIKNLFTIIAILFISLAYSQNWTYSAGSSKFEGFSYSYASVEGVGKFPYSSPVFAVRNSLDFGVEIMLSKINYSPSSGHIKIYVDDSRVFYFDYSTSADKNTVFLWDEEQRVELIKLLREGNRLFVRVYTGSGSYSYEFPLLGSTSSINKAVGSYVEDYETEKRLAKSAILREQREEADAKYQAVLKQREEAKQREEQARARVDREDSIKRNRADIDRKKAEALRVDKEQNPGKYAEIKRQKKEEEEAQIKANKKSDKRARRKQRKGGGPLFWIGLGVLVLAIMLVPS
jgi:hypothetical protein